ncbi:MAG: HAD family hydrolase [Eubacterium sp.]|nr:HAD family hydrolase [Eubacterium sp.]
MNQEIKWLFFDLGSTLIDESDCAEYRTQELLKQPNAPTRDILEKRMIELSKENRLPYKDAAKEFGLETMKWPSNLEKLYVDTPKVLETLKKKYHLGIIANQKIGTEQRLTEYGIRDYFDVIISSAEAGVSKPDLQIFKLALTEADCMPEESYMIGDRLDNDIEPAAMFGMNTIWVRQGSFSHGNPKLIKYKPEVIVDRLEVILKYL